MTPRRLRPRFRQRRDPSGWTLLEMMVAIAAFAPMMLGLLALFQGSMKVFVAGANELDSLQMDRAMIDLTGQHLRSALFVDNTVPSDDADVGAGKGRHQFRFLGLDNQANSPTNQDWLSWHGIVFHTTEQDADGGDVQYLEIQTSTYASRNVLRFLTGAGTSKASDATPYPQAALPAGPTAPPSNADNALMDNVALLDFDYAVDTPAPTTWQNTWDSASKKRIPRWVRMSVRVMSEDGADSTALSTIFYLPMWNDTSPWPGGIRP